MQYPLNLKLVLKLTWTISLFARNEKILPSNVLFWSTKQHRRGFRILDPQRTQRRVQNFWSPKQHVRWFRISDPQKKTTKGLEFDPQKPQERIQYFWSPKEQRIRFRISDPLQRHTKWFRVSDPLQRQTKGFRISDPLQRQTKGFRISDPLQRRTKVFRIFDPRKNTGEDSEFLIPYNDTKWFRISDLPLNRIPNFLSPTNIVSRGIRISDHPNNPREKIISLSGLKAVTKSEVKVNIKGFWSKLFHHHKFLFNHESYYQCTCSHIKSINIISLKTWFRTCCLPEQCLIKIFFLDNNNRNFMQVHYIPYTQIIMQEW